MKTTSVQADASARRTAIAFALTAAFLCLLFVFLFKLSTSARSARDAQVAEQRAAIERSIQARSMRHDDPAMSFDPATARLVHEKETRSGTHAVVLEITRVYRGESGSYFLFVGTASDAGFVKRLTVEEARGALMPYRASFEAEFGNSTARSDTSIQN